MNLALGVDALRLWAASTDYTHDVNVGTDILKQIGESLRRIRNTSRFMLSNTHDMTPGKLVPYDSLRDFDKAALTSVRQFVLSCDEAYDSMNFQNVFKLTRQFCAGFSGSYLEVVKDRLYNDAVDCPARKSAQTTLVHMLNAIMLTNAPILPHLMEELYEHVAPCRNQHQPERFSVFQQEWRNEQYDIWKSDTAANEWSCLQDIRQIVNVAIEDAREAHTLKGTVECDVEIRVPSKCSKSDIIHKYQSELADLLSVAKCTVRFDSDVVSYEITAVARKSVLHRCARCWKHTAPEPNQVCSRCSSVLRAFDLSKLNS